MKKQIIKKENGIIQLTTIDERWYIKDIQRENNEVEHKMVPSVTWITSYYYKSPYLMEWIAKQGWDEAEAIKRAASDKGSKVHAAIVDLIDGNKIIGFDTAGKVTQYRNPTTEQLEDLTIEEYEAIMSFVDWYIEVKPKVLAREFVIWSDEFNYAGTVDLLCEINGEKYIIDFKTSKSVWTEFKLQVSAYKKAYLEGVRNDLLQLAQKEKWKTDRFQQEAEPYKNIKLGILQLGYGLNRKGFKFTDVDDKFELFLSAQQMWKEEAGKVEPKQKDYPEVLELPKLTN